MIHKISIILVLVATFVGCTHVKQIPIPSTDWTYTKAEEIEAELKLTVLMEHEIYGGLGKHEFFFKSKDISNGLYLGTFDLGKSVLMDGADSSFHSSVRITDLTQAGVIIDFYKRESSPDTNFKIDHVILIPFDEIGSIQVVDVKYTWVWTKLNPNQELQPTVKTPVKSGNEQGTAAEL